MTLTLELPPELESALANAAQEQGKTPAQEAVEALPRLYTAPQQTTSSFADPTLALFAQWAEEDTTDDPEELARRQQEGDELMASLRGSRVSFEGRTDFSRLLENDEVDAAA